MNFRPLVCCGLLALGIAAFSITVDADAPKDPEELTTEERLALTEQRLAESEQRIRDLEEKLEQVLRASEISTASGKSIHEGATSVAVTEPLVSDTHAESHADKDSSPALSAYSTAAIGVSDFDAEDDSHLNGDVRAGHRVLLGDELASADFPGSWPMFGSDMRMKLGGYIKADFVADLDGTRNPEQFLMATIPVAGEPDYGDDGYYAFFAKETRFNLDFRKVLPSSVPLRGFLEGDFFSSSNQFKLRHAYMSAGDFLIGQTWTTLSMLESLPYTIDFAAGDALFGGRTTQFRYQNRLSDQWKLSVGLEELSFLGIDNPYHLPGGAKRESPLLAVRTDYDWDTGTVALGASVTRLHWDGGSLGPSDEATQYAAVVGGRQNLGAKAYATWNVSYTEGGGENIMAFAGSNANAVLNANGQLETIPSFAAVLGLGYAWTPKWSSNLGYAYGWLDTPDSRQAFALKRGGIGHLNLIWNPVDNLSAGAEFMWGVTRIQNDALGKAQRIQLMGKYEF